MPGGVVEIDEVSVNRTLRIPRSSFLSSRRRARRRASRDRTAAGHQARIRGEVVRRLSDAGILYGAEWTSVHVYDEQQRMFDLRDPFETEERWIDAAPA